MFGVLLFIFVSTLNSPDSFKEKIEARAGSEIITTTDLEQMMETLLIEFPLLPKDELRQKALSTLVDQALISQFLEKMGIAVTDREIDQRINSVRATNGIQTQEQFRLLLERQGLSFDKFRNQIRRQMEAGQFYGFIRRQATRTIEETDLKSFYQNHIDRYQNNLEVELQECLVPMAKGEALAESEAMAFSKESNGFQNCIGKYRSTSGGDLGRFRHGMLREDVEQKVFAMKPGESTVFKSKNGFQILKVKGIKNLGPQSFESVKDSIRESVESELIQKEYQRMLSELKASTFVKI